MTARVTVESVHYWVERTRHIEYRWRQGMSLTLSQRFEFGAVCYFYESRRRASRVNCVIHYFITSIIFVIPTQYRGIQLLILRYATMRSTGIVFKEGQFIFLSLNLYSTRFSMNSKFIACTRNEITGDQMGNVYCFNYRTLISRN